MNILLIKHFFVGFMVYEIYRVSVFGHSPYSVTFPHHTLYSMTCISKIFPEKIIKTSRFYFYIKHKQRSPLT